MKVDPSNLMRRVRAALALAALVCCGCPSGGGGGYRVPAAKSDSPWLEEDLPSDEAEADVAEIEAQSEPELGADCDRTGHAPAGTELEQE